MYLLPNFCLKFDLMVNYQSYLFDDVHVLHHGRSFCRFFDLDFLEMMILSHIHLFVVSIRLLWNETNFFVTSSFLIFRFSRFFSASRYYFDTLLALWYIYFPPSSFLIKSTFTFCFSPDLCLSPLGPDFCTKINRDAPWKVDQNRYRPLPKRCLRNQSHFFCMYLLPTRIS